jgi:hypothetical protein
VLGRQLFAGSHHFERINPQTALESLAQFSSAYRFVAAWMRPDVPRPRQKESSCFASLFLQLARVDGLMRALMKTRITLPENGRGEKRRVIITVEFGKERMTIEIIVAAEPDENEMRKLAIARARDFARKFALDSV